MSTADEPKPDDTPVDDASPEALHAVARYVYIDMTSRFGEPTDIAASGRITKATADAMRFWIRSLESLTRLILFILAFAIASPPRKRQAKPDARAKDVANDGSRAGDAEWGVPSSSIPPDGKTPSPIPADPDNPASWPVHFKFWRANRDKLDIIIDFNDPSTYAFLYEPKPAPKPRQPRESLPGCNAWPLALRLQAVFRALDDPKTYAQKLAKLLETGNRQFSFEPKRQPPQGPVRRGCFQRPLFSPCQGAVERALRRCCALADSYWPADFFDAAPDTS